MTWWVSLLLGLIQGLTEFLPVSSSGHLAIVQKIYQSVSGEELANPLLFDVLLHMGTLGAVIAVFRRDVANLINAFFSFFSKTGRSDEKTMPLRRFFLLLTVATLPLLAVVAFTDKVEVLMGNLIFVGCALLLTGILLALADRSKPGRRNERTARMSDAAVIGVMQAVAVIPGLSRSGSTITAGLMRDFDRQFAIRFSFLMSIPAVLGATLLHTVKVVKEGIDAAELLIYIPGMLAAAVSGYFAILLLKRMAAKGKFGSFAGYCAAVGVLAIILEFVIK